MPHDPAILPAQQRLHKAIAEEYTLIGPKDDPDIKGDCLLSEWVLVANWVDENNDAWTVTLSSPGLSRTAKLGLLVSHLHD